MSVVDKRDAGNKKSNAKNRQRFINRAKQVVKKAVNDKIGEESIPDLSGGKNVKVKTNNDDSDTREHTFNKDQNTGDQNNVVPGNDRFNRGDTIPKPQEGQGGQGKGKEAGDGDDGEEDFQFELTREEFLDFLFEDLELPDLVKRSLRNTTFHKNERRGFSVDGNPSQVDLVKSTKNAQARRIGLGRLSKNKQKSIEKRIAELREQIDNVINQCRKDLIDLNNDELVANFPEQLLNHSKILKNIFPEYKRKVEKLSDAGEKRKKVPFFDPVDIRYRRFEKIPQPITHAVMFCVMDVSASMGEFEKDIAKRFFLLLYMFLDRQYSSVEIRFIRHTTNAEEVDEQTFFYDRKMGGTLISSSLDLVGDIIEKEIDVETTNIYLAQASDGDNWVEDNEACYEILKSRILDNIQYYAYIEIEEGANIIDLSKITSDFYKMLESMNNEFEIVKTHLVTDKANIFEVFAKLFKKRLEKKG